MEISFATEALKEACLAREPKADDLPREVIDSLHTLYNAMRIADNVAELPLGLPESGGDCEWRIDLVKGYRVVVRVNHARPAMNDHRIDWTRVYRVLLIAIEAPNA
jgi:hypothetical protein